MHKSVARPKRGPRTHAKDAGRTMAGGAKSGGEVAEFLATLSHPRRLQVDALRAVILGADRRIGESIKWNAPSFYLRDHFATLRLPPAETVQVVFHTGAKAKSNAAQMEIRDPSGLLKWVAADRCLATFSMEDIRAKKSALASIVRQWIRQL